MGAPVSRYYQFTPGGYLPVGVQLLHIISDSLGATRVPMGHVLVGGIREALRVLAEKVAQQSWPYSETLATPECVTGEPHHLYPETLFDVPDVVAPHDVIYIKGLTSTTTALW